MNKKLLTVLWFIWPIVLISVFTLFDLFYYFSYGLGYFFSGYIASLVIYYIYKERIKPEVINNE